MQSLLAEFIKFNFAGKVLPDEILDFLAHRRLEAVLVDLVEIPNLVVINLRSSGEEARYVLFKNGESGVEILEHSDNGVLRLNSEFRPFQRALSVERAATQ